MAYIGNSPGVSSQRIVTTVTATAGQTTFTPSSGYTVGYLDVYLNGIKLINGTDYTASNGSTVVLTDAAALDDVVELMAYIPRGLSDGYTKSEADARYDATGTAAALVDDLSGVTNASTARTNLGLGSLATKSTVGTDDITDGAVTAAKLAAGAAVPSQTGQSGKYLTTDGTTASWGTITQPTPAAVSSQANTATDYFDLPSGTTAQRPASPNTGMIRYNTTESEYEVYNGTAWKPLTKGDYTYTVDYLVVAGGGGGGRLYAGGGGAGGMLSGTGYSVTGGSGYSIVVGAGGSGRSSNGSGSSGANSSGFGVTAIGGGGGGGGSSVSGLSGGSGGGGSGFAGGGTGAPGGSGTSGQGNSGGTGISAAATDGGGGGGGKGAAGQSAGNANPTGAGGVGAQWLDGNYYAGGGGGSTNAAGGNGGGGNGVAGGGGGFNGTSNTGGGGGATNNGSASGSGGSGVVIIRYLGSQRGTGGTVTSSGGYTYHTFTSSGTFTA